MSDKPQYRWEAFKNWMNLIYLALAVLGGLAFGWFVFIMFLLGEGFILWLVPDLAVFRKSVDASHKVGRFQERRRFYIKELFAVEAPSGGLFREDAVDWAKVFEESYPFAAYWESKAAGGAGASVAKIFLRLIEIVGILGKQIKVKSSTISSVHIEQVEDGINAFLSLHYMAKGLEESLSRLDSKKQLQKEFKGLRQSAKAAERGSRLIIQQRLQTLQKKIQKIPAMEQRRGLALAKAEAIVNKIETLYDHVRTSEGAAEVAYILDGLVDSQELLEGDFDRAEVAQEIQGDMIDLGDEEIWDRMERGLGL